MTWWLPKEEGTIQPPPFKSWVDLIDEGETPPPADPFPTTWMES